MSQESPNSSNHAYLNLPKTGYSADSYLSHFLNWQRHIMIPSRVEECRVKDLHPYTRLLTLNDLDSCQVLENIAYDDKRNCASREKLEYRLSKCAELCQGLFCTVVKGSESGFEAETIPTSSPVETNRVNGALSVLLGYVIATKTNDLLATLDSMGYPDDWRSQNPLQSNVGHQPNGRNVVLHSVAVLPGFRSRGIGKILVKSFMQQIIGAGISDRITLITHKDKIAWYEKMDFKNLGPSDIEFGSGGWYNMVYEIGQTKTNLGGIINFAPFDSSANVETEGKSEAATELESKSDPETATLTKSVGGA